jgi:hypothetical protein
MVFKKGSVMHNKSAPQKRFLRYIGYLPASLLLFVLLGIGVAMLWGGMVKITAWYLFLLALPVLGLLVLVGSLLFAMIKKRWHGAVIVNLIAAAIALLPAISNLTPFPYPASITHTTPAVTVRLPSDVPLKVAWGGDRLKNNYHVVAPDQRWAYDLLVEPYVNGSTRVEDYGCYGVTIVAPADGTVVIAHDGEPNAEPGKVSNNYTVPSGNEVAIRLKETGTFLLIAHMKPGSVLVKVGDEVVEGQPIGQCGNSGNTSEPHIHIHHQRQDPNFYPLNYAEGLPMYFSDQTGPPMPLGGIKMVDGKPVLTGDVVQHIPMTP